MILTHINEWRQKTKVKVINVKQKQPKFVFVFEKL